MRPHGNEGNVMDVFHQVVIQMAPKQAVAAPQEQDNWSSFGVYHGHTLQRYGWYLRFHLHRLAQPDREQKHFCQA